jgi:outer membrane protein assembly factor BamE (lipoprotein component of BamABCDE complex)
MRKLHFLPLLLLTAFLAGCAIPSAIKPGASADELLQKLGKPTETRPGPEGGESWDYAYGPEGVQTWRFDIDRGRTVRTATQLLTQEQLYRVVPGVTTEADVRGLLGKPREIVKYREETAWEWRVAIGPEYGVFIVRFGPDGKATGINVLKDVIFDDRDSGP